VVVLDVVMHVVAQLEVTLLEVTLLEVIHAYHVVTADHPSLAFNRLGSSRIIIGNRPGCIGATHAIESLG
jgi:hypothetical protein